MIFLFLSRKNLTAIRIQFVDAGAASSRIYGGTLSGICSNRKRKKRLSAEQIEALQQEWVTANEHKDEAEQLTLDL